MATQYENFTVTEINFLETAGNDLDNAGILSLTIIPADGFTVDANDFSLAAPIPNDITGYSFIQSGSNVLLSFQFAPSTIMPANNIEFPLCIQGTASLELFTIQGNFTINAVNSSITNETGTYSESGSFNSTEQVLTKTIEADSGYYFFNEPIISLVTGNNDSYTIVSNKTYDIDSNLIAVTFNVSYTYPAQNISGDLIVIQAEALPIFVATEYINAFTINGSTGYNFTANTEGQVLTLNLIGDPNATYSAELIDANSVVTTLASNLIIGATGTATISGIIIPNYNENKHPYEIVISGDINPSIETSTGIITVDILQQEPVSLTVTATSTDPNITITGIPDAINLSPNTSYNPGSEPVLNFSFTASTAGDIITVIDTIDANSFSPIIPDPLDVDFIYSLQNISQSLNVSEDEFTVTGQIVISSTGDYAITHTLNLDNIITTPAAPPITFNSVVAVDDCNDQEGIATTIVTVNQDDVIVGSQLSSTSGGNITDLAIGVYRMSNGLTDGDTYLIYNIPNSLYIVEIGNNGEINTITDCGVQ